MMFTSSLTRALPIILSGGGRRRGVSGKYSSKNSRIAIDCLIMTVSPEKVVNDRVGTLALGLREV